MKNAYLSVAFIAIFSLAGVSQSIWSVPEDNAGLVTKITATWCGPCGDWGWTAMEELMAEYGEDNIVISLYAPSSSKLHNAGAAELADEIGYGGTPNFAGNGLDQGTAAASAGNILDTFPSATTLGNAAYEIEKVDNDTVTIKVKTKFFDDVDGKFHLNIFMVENHVIEEQTNQGPDASHHNVHRGRFIDMVDSSDVVLDGAAAKNDILVSRYQFVVGPGWKYEEMFIVASLWMENPEDAADLIYINGTKAPQLGLLEDGFGAEGGDGNNGEWPIGVKEVSTQESVLYPNPASDFFTIQQKGSGAMTVQMSDLLGKTVFEGQFNGSKNTINTNDFPEGIYMVRISTASGTQLERLVIK